MERILAATPDDSANKQVLTHPSTILPDADVERYLSDIGVEAYGAAETKPKEAARAFRSAGWRKEAGNWHDENGEKVVFRCRSGAGQTIMNQRIQVLNTLLEEHGFSAELVTLEGSTLWNDFRQGDFPVQWAPWQATLPTAAFESAIAGPVGSQLNVPRTVTVPEVGDVGGEDMIEVDIEEQMQGIISAQNDSALAEPIRTLGWVCNQTVPALPIYIGEATTPIDTANWSWPAEDDPVWSTPSPQAYLAQKQALPTPK
jgi:hypothetical protein